MARVKALSNIKHDGVDYVAGDVLDLSDSQAEALINGNVAEEVNSAPKGGTPAESKRLDSNKKGRFTSKKAQSE